MVEEGDGAGAGAVGEVGGAEEEVPRRFKMGPMAVVDHGGGREEAEWEGEEYGEEGGAEVGGDNSPSSAPMAAVSAEVVKAGANRAITRRARVRLLSWWMAEVEAEEEVEADVDEMA